MPVNLAAIRDLLLPGLKLVFGDYRDIPQQWSEVFDRGSSDKNMESAVEMAMLPLAQLKAEAGSVYYDTGMGQRYKYNIIHNEVALGFLMTRPAIDDNLYKTQFSPNSRALKRSFMQTKEIFGANILNNGTVLDPNVGGDGVSLYSASHPIDGGVIGNRPAIDLEFNESSLESSLTAIRAFKDARGLKYMSRARKAIMPAALEWQAERVFNTVGRVGTADNDLNAVKSKNAVPEGYVVMDFLTNPKFWALKTDCPDGFQYLERIPFDKGMKVDDDTFILKTWGYERYGFGFWNWRCTFGHFPV